MSYYTGRYVSSHGATWNRVPLSAAEHTLGDYLRAAGRTATLAGKTHVLPDDEGARALRHRSRIGARRAAARRRIHGGRPVRRSHAAGPESGYAAWLRAHGYAGADPWSEHVIAVDAGGRVASGWQMRNVHLPSRVAEQHSETAYMTDLALDWIRAQGDTPWVLHLSYVKPHWPYVAPAPFHAMFRNADVGPILHGPQDGTADEHPVVRAYREHDECRSFAQEAVARHVRPAYMGLIAELDVHLGRVLDALTAMGRLADTLIVFASDHGEFSGDRGLGEKELFYDEIVRVPFIVCDPDPRADATRGTRRCALRRRDRRRADDPRRARDPRSAASHRRTLAPAADARRTPLRRGAMPCSASSTTGSAARGGCSGRGVRECRGFMVRTQRVEVRPLGGLPAAALRSRRRSAGVGRSRRRRAARRGARAAARAAVRLDGDGEAPDDRHRRTWSKAAPMPIARTASTSVSGDDRTVAKLRVGSAPRQPGGDDEQPCG